MPNGLLIGQHRFVPISVPVLLLLLPAIRVAFLKDPVLALRLLCFFWLLFLLRTSCCCFGPIVGLSCVLTHEQVLMEAWWQAPWVDDHAQNDGD